MLPESKKCKGKNSCGLEQPLENFYKARTGKYGRMSKCKTCYNLELDSKYPRQTKKIENTIVDMIVETSSGTYQHTNIKYFVNDNFLVINDFTENNNHYYPLSSILKFIEKIMPDSVS